MALEQERPATRRQEKTFYTTSIEALFIFHNVQSIKYDCFLKILNEFAVGVEVPQTLTSNGKSSDLFSHKLISL